MQELGIQPPDPVLLLATLDRFAAGLAKQSTQVAFRLQVTRAALRVDVAPTENGIQQFAESLMAEGEAAFHGGSIAPLKDTVKVKALDGDGGGTRDEGGKPREGREKVKESSEVKGGKDAKESKNDKFEAKNGKGDSKGGGSEKPVCRYFEQLKVKLLDDQASLPTRASSQAAGWDLASSCYVELKPGERKLVPLGISVELPAGCYGRIASRSSFALRGIDVAGVVIDPDYRGEVKIILVNNGMDDLVINAGDRVGQLVLERFAVVEAVSSRVPSEEMGLRKLWHCCTAFVQGPLRSSRGRHCRTPGR